MLSIVIDWRDGTMEWPTAKTGICGCSSLIRWMWLSTSVTYSSMESTWTRTPSLNPCPTNDERDNKEIDKTTRKFRISPPFPVIITFFSLSLFFLFTTESWKRGFRYRRNPFRSSLARCQTWRLATFSCCLLSLRSLRCLAQRPNSSQQSITGEK